MGVTRISRFLIIGAAMSVPVVISGLGCIGTSAGEADESAGRVRRVFPLNTLPTTTITVNENAIRAWLVTGPDEREEGLMWVIANEIADDQGMLFVFPDEAYRGFWMKNTVTPLDIAFARMNGVIVATHTMPPLTLQTFPSIEPAMFALEMKAGSFDRLGVRVGDRLDIPDDVFKNVR